jgi:hypothetical protein
MSGGLGIGSPLDLSIGLRESAPVGQPGAAGSSGAPG